jgi:hypothetical protein
MTKQQQQDSTKFIDWLHAQQSPAQQSPAQVELEKKLFNGPFAKPSTLTLGDSIAILSSGEM